MTKIIFVNPPLSLKERYGDLAAGGSLLPPLGLAHLAAVTRKEGFKTQIMDVAALGMDVKEATEEITDQSPKYVGITAATTSIYNAARLAREIKEKDKDITTVIGGPHLTSLPEKTMEMFPQFDFGVVGEGEATIVELLSQLEQNEDLEKIKGLVMRKNGKIIKTPLRPFIDDLDTLPLPAWDLLPDLTRYYRGAAHSFLRLPSSSLITSRGCPGKCTFCDRSVFGKKCRAFSARYLMVMIKHLVKNYGIRDIVFHDDTFIAFKARLRELCQRLKRERLNLVWSCTARVDYVDPQILKVMREAGCWQIAYGIESGSQQILDFLKKEITLRKIEKALKWTKEAGIRSRGYFMIGVPRETKETIEMTIDFAKRIDLDDFHISFFSPYPGTELYKRVEKYGTFYEEWPKMNGWFPVFIPKGLTQGELERYQKIAFKEFYLRPKIILSYLSRLKHPRTFCAALFKGGGTLIKTVLRMYLTPSFVNKKPVQK